MVIFCSSSLCHSEFCRCYFMSLLSSLFPAAKLWSFSFLFLCKLFFHSNCFSQQSYALHISHSTVLKDNQNLGTIQKTANTPWKNVQNWACFSSHFYRILFPWNVQLLAAVLQVLCAALVLLVPQGFCIALSYGRIYKEHIKLLFPSKQSKENKNMDC